MAAKLVTARSFISPAGRPYTATVTIDVDTVVELLAKRAYRNTGGRAGVLCGGVVVKLTPDIPDDAPQPEMKPCLRGNGDCPADCCTPKL